MIWRPEIKESECLSEKKKQLFVHIESNVESNFSYILLFINKCPTSIFKFFKQDNNCLSYLIYMNKTVDLIREINLFILFIVS